MAAIAHPPVPITTVLDAGINAILAGSAGWLHVPAGGYLNVTWLSKKRCYRLTIDVTPGHALELDYARDWLAELAEKYAKTPSETG